MCKAKPQVFFDVSVDGDPAERLVFELFTDAAPKTAENFRALCTGEKGDSPQSGKPLHYKGTFFHRIIKGSMAQGGDLLRRNGNYGESIYGGKFPEESPKRKHDSRGLLSMLIADRNERGSLFSVSFKADRTLDRKCIVFGKLVRGHELLNKIEEAGDEEGTPSVTVKICNIGELHEGKDGSRGAVLLKGKYKKSLKERKERKERKKKRRRRRYSSSESSSDSSSESESDSDSSESESEDSESDSDSESSSTESSSSSDDDKRRKRKRSRRGRHKRGIRKDRRREKKRKRKFKRNLKRTSDSSSESESDSKSGSISDDNGGKARVLGANHDKLEVVEEKGKSVAAINDERGDESDMLKREDAKIPKENGEHRSNGIVGENRSVKSSASNKSPVRQPDVLDDHSGKSRSRSVGPRRSMSISPRRNSSRSKSRSVSPSRRSRSVSRRSPVESGSRSRSPVRGKRVRSGASVSVSVSPPVRGRSRRSVTRSPTVSPPKQRVIRSPSRNSLSVSRSPSPVRSYRKSLSTSPPLIRPSITPSPSPSPVPRCRSKHRSCSRSPRRGRSLSRSPLSDGSPKCIRRGRGFSERYAYVRRYRSPSPIRSHGYVRDRYPSYRRSPPRRYRSPPRRRTPIRYRNRSRTRSRSPIRYRARRSPVRSRSQSRSPIKRRTRSPSQSISGSSLSSRGSESPKRSPKVKSRSRSRSSSGSASSNPSPPRTLGLASYGNGSP